MHALSEPPPAPSVALMRPADGADPDHVAFDEPRSAYMSTPRRSPVAAPPAPRGTAIPRPSGLRIPVRGRVAQVACHPGQVAPQLLDVGPQRC
jgi:hypothetical protein